MRLPPSSLFAQIVLAILCVQGVHHLFGEEGKPNESKDEEFRLSHAQFDKGSGGLVLEYTVLVPVFIERVVRDGDKKRVEKIVKYRAETRARVVTKGFKVFDEQWKPVPDEKLSQLLAKRSKVFLRKSSMQPMVSQLKKLGKGALIVVTD